MHELRNQNISVDYWVPRSVIKNYCVLRKVKAKQREAETHKTKNLVEFCNHPLPPIYYGLTNVCMNYVVTNVWWLLTWQNKTVLGKSLADYFRGFTFRRDSYTLLVQLIFLVTLYLQICSGLNFAFLLNFNKLPMEEF